MNQLEILRDISVKTPSRIVLLVFDGLGGLPNSETGKTELETARIPNLDRLATEGICGLAHPVGPGITPGSAPGHLSLFGYNPLEYTVGRGVLEVLGVDFELAEGDVAVRCNFCTVDGDGIITDRRAGRIDSEKSAELCQRLRKISMEGIEIFVLPVREHRFATVLRGVGLSGDVEDTDPQQTGLMPKEAVSLSRDADRTASIINEFVAKARSLLCSSSANMVLLRGISQLPNLPQMGDIFKLTSAAITTYPMYRGLAKLVGMEVLATGVTFADKLSTLTSHWDNHDFFYIHLKQIDSSGEDGDFQRKVQLIEEADLLLPQLLELKPDVVVVTADHSTPALLKGHSWHPVPLIIHSRYCRVDEVKEFSEKGCVAGGLGIVKSTDIMPLAMANALKLNKFGA